MYPLEGAAFGLGEGLPATFAAVATLFLAMDHDVSLALASVCSAALVVAKLLVRVHAASLYLLTLDTSKDASRPASLSTQLSSTVPWGATCALRTAENSIKAKFAESSFHALG